MAANHLGRRGYAPNPTLLFEEVEDEHGDTRSVRLPTEVISRRSRKQVPNEHSCSHMACTLGNISYDDVYVQYAENRQRFTGKGRRYHFFCAVEADIIRRVGTDQTTDRRQAVLMTRAKA